MLDSHVDGGIQDDGSENFPTFSACRSRKDKTNVDFCLGRWWIPSATFTFVQQKHNWSWQPCEKTRGEWWTHMLLRAFLAVSENKCIKLRRPKLSYVYRKLWYWDSLVLHRKWVALIPPKLLHIIHHCLLSTAAVHRFRNNDWYGCFPLPQHVSPAEVRCR